MQYQVKVKKKKKKKDPGYVIDVKLIIFKKLLLKSKYLW